MPFSDSISGVEARTAEERQELYILGLLFHAGMT